MPLLEFTSIIHAGIILYWFIENATTCVKYAHFTEKLYIFCQNVPENFLGWGWGNPQDVAVTAAINIFRPHILVKCTTNSTNKNIFRNCTYKYIKRVVYFFPKIIGGGGGGDNYAVRSSISEIICIFYKNIN